jgi:hypothetical protein
MLIFFALSCVEDNVEKAFDKPAIERSRESISSLRERLQASEFGWEASYKPSKAETGYYKFVFRFLKDSVVEIASDFSAGDLALRKSEYSVLQGSTTKLSFSTFGTIHKLSDSNFSPIPGQLGAGLKGDFEFLYYGETDEGDLIFRTNRTQDTLMFKRASASSVSDLTLSYNYISKLNGGKSVYRSLQESKDGNVVQSSFDFPYNARVIEIRSVIEEEVDGEIVSSFDGGYITGYGLTPTGIFVDSVKLSTGEIARNVQFSFDEDENRFVTTLSDGTQLAIGDSNAPIIPVDGHKFFLDATLTSNLQFIYGDADIGGLTTPGFETLIENAAPIGLSGVLVFYRQLAFGGGKIDYLLLAGTPSVVNGSVRQLLIYEDKGDRLVMTRNGFRDANSAVKPANTALYDEFLDFLTDPEGFYVENLGRATRFSNLVFTFTSVKDPSIRFGMYHVAP